MDLTTTSIGGGASARRAKPHRRKADRIVRFAAHTWDVES